MSSAAAIEYESEHEIIHNALPVCLCPWLENPYRLVSLWDMLRFNAGSFAVCSASLIKYWQGLKHGALITDRGIQELAYTLGELQENCRNHGLTSTLNQVNRIRQYCRDETVRAEMLSQLLGEAVVRLEEDLSSRMFLAVPINLVNYYEQSEPLFGLEVAKKFPSSTYDIAEAGKCFALHRSTAAVFHLMRVLELGLSALAARFGIPCSHTNWQTVIEGIEKAIRGMGSDPKKPADWKQQQEFFSQAASSLMLIKDAWRNYTMHARGKYTEDEVETIFPNVRAFMQKLATRLHE